MIFADITDAPVVPGVPRDGKDRPMVVPCGGGKPVPYARMTTFIDCIEDKSALAKWGKRRVLHGLAVKPSLLEKAAGLDPDTPHGRGELDKLAEVAMEASGANDKREKGTELHGYSEFVDRGEPLPASVSDADRLDMAAYALATNGMLFTHIEQFVVVPDLKVGGTPDRIMRFEQWVRDYITFPPGADPDDHYIFDLKTGTVEYGALKMASQLAGYSRAQFYDFTVMPAPPWAPKVTKKGDPEGFERWKEWDAWCKTEFDADLAATAYSPIPPVNQHWGIILNLPAGSGEAELYWANLDVGWEAASLATTIRAMRSLSGKALMPFNAGVGPVV